MSQTPLMWLTLKQHPPEVGEAVAGFKESIKNEKEYSNNLTTCDVVNIALRFKLWNLFTL